MAQYIQDGAGQVARILIQTWYIQVFIIQFIEEKGGFTIVSQTTLCVCVCVCVCIYICVCVYMCVCVCVYISNIHLVVY